MNLMNPVLVPTTEVTINFWRFALVCAWKLVITRLEWNLLLGGSTRSSRVLQSQNEVYLSSTTDTNNKKNNKNTEQQQPQLTVSFGGAGDVSRFGLQERTRSYSGSKNSNNGIWDNHGQQQQQQRNRTCSDGVSYHNRQQLYSNDGMRIIEHFL